MFYILIMNLSNFDNHSKNLAFEKFKHFLHKYYSRFPKICKNSAYLNKFLALLYDCVSHTKHFVRINKLLKNANVIQLGIGKNLPAALYSETTKPETFLIKQGL